MKRHQKSKICTTEKVIFKCQICLKILSTKQYLQQHLLKCESKAKKLTKEKDESKNESKNESKDAKEKIIEVANELKTLLVAFLENNK